MSDKKIPAKLAKKLQSDANEKVKTPIITKRVYGQQMEFDSDLFKLEVNNMLKNIGWDDKNPILKNVEHCHFFRTIDSSGRKQKRSSYVGGHVHDVEAYVDEQGNLKAKCSPAYGSKFDDKHIHDVTYIRSDRIEKRKLNEAAQRSIDKLNEVPRLAPTPQGE